MRDRRESVGREWASERPEMPGSGIRSQNGGLLDALIRKYYRLRFPPTSSLEDEAAAYCAVEGSW